MTQVLAIRDSILERTKQIRQKDDSITICPDQVRAHHMFLRILKFLFVIIFSRKICLFDKNYSYYWYFIVYFDS